MYLFMKKLIQRFKNGPFLGSQHNNLLLKYSAVEQGQDVKGHLTLDAQCKALLRVKVNVIQIRNRSFGPIHGNHHVIMKACG